MSENITVKATLVDEMSAPMSKIKNNANSLNSEIKNIALSSVGAAVSLGSVATALKYVFNETNQQQVVTQQLNAVIKSTSMIAGVTSESAIQLAESLSKVSRFDDDVILGAENMLLTFTNVGQNVFPEATKAILDMSVALGQELKETTMQVGKALQSPVEGMAALQRVGVRFSDSQKEVVRQLVETGKSAEAQKMIIAELNNEFGGSAQANLETWGSKFQKIIQGVAYGAKSLGTMATMITGIGPQDKEMARMKMQLAAEVYETMRDKYGGERYAKQEKAEYLKRLAEYKVFLDADEKLKKDGERLALENAARNAEELKNIKINSDKETALIINQNQDRSIMDADVARKKDLEAENLKYDIELFKSKDNSDKKEQLTKIHRAAISEINKKYDSEQKDREMLHATEQGAQELKNFIDRKNQYEKNNALYEQGYDFRRKIDEAEERAMYEQTTREIENAKKKSESIANIAQQYGQALAAGIGKGSEGLKESLKAVANTTISFLEQKLLAAESAAILDAILTGGLSIAPSVAALVAGTAALEAARAGVNSFQTTPGYSKQLPGTPNQPVMVMAHGGEIYRPGGGSSTTNNNSGHTININIPAGANITTAGARDLARSLDAMARSGAFDKAFNLKRAMAV